MLKVFDKNNYPSTILWLVMASMALKQLSWNWKRKRSFIKWKRSHIERNIDLWRWKNIIAG
jgi:hypothetical protein